MNNEEKLLSRLVPQLQARMAKPMIRSLLIGAALLALAAPVQAGTDAPKKPKEIVTQLWDDDNRLGMMIERGGITTYYSVCNKKVGSSKWINGKESTTTRVASAARTGKELT
jgi:hypothetical protein